MSASGESGSGLDKMIRCVHAVFGAIDAAHAIAFFSARGLHRDEWAIRSPAPSAGIKLKPFAALSPDRVSPARSDMQQCGSIPDNVRRRPLPQCPESRHSVAA